MYCERNPQANQNYNQSLATTPLCAGHMSPHLSWGHSAVVLYLSFPFLARSFETVLFPGSAMLFLMAGQVIHGLLPGEQLMGRSVGHLWLAPFLTCPLLVQFLPSILPKEVGGPRSHLCCLPAQNLIRSLKLAEAVAALP